MCDSSGLHTDKLKTTTAQCKLPSTLTLTRTACSTPALLHCGHWKPIEIALQLSLIKLQLCHKPHMKSTRGKARRDETERDQSRWG